jgi:hypothetical protein
LGWRRRFWQLTEFNGNTLTKGDLNMAQKIQLRRDTLANWNTANPVLAAGEVAFITGSRRIKIGDGATAFNTLGFLTIDYADIANAPVAFDGNYANLTNKPVLFSGVYADLAGKPVLFDGAYASLTGKPDLAAITIDGGAAGG